MAYYPPEVIKKVKQIDLLTYLKNYEPEELVHFSRNTFSTKSHDSLKISNGMWYWFSHDFGGKSALDYLIKVKEYSFSEAMEKILSKLDNIVLTESNFVHKKQNSKLILPRRSASFVIAKNYLMNRSIDEEILQECFDNNLIYQDCFNNVVFVGYDNNKTARYAMCRKADESRFMHEASGSHKAFSFRLEASIESESVHIFESAIDLLSYATLLKKNGQDWSNYNLLSLAGVYQPSIKKEAGKIPIALNLFLNNHPNIHKIFLHLDNDRAGRDATLSLINALQLKYIVIDNPPPYGKDVNDFLCSKNQKKIKKGRDIYEI